MPEQVALDVEALLAVVAHEGPLARVRALVYEHGRVRRELLVADGARLVRETYRPGGARPRRRRVVRLRELLVRVRGLDVPHPVARRRELLLAQVALQGRERVVLVLELKRGD